MSIHLDKFHQNTPYAKGMQKEAMSSFAEIHQRIQFATHTRTQMELAEVLGIRQSSISDAKRRGSIPADWYMKLFKKYGLNPDWVETGDAPMYLRTKTGYGLQEAPGLAERPDSYGTAAARIRELPLLDMHCSYDGGDPPPLNALDQLSLPQYFAGKDIRVFRMNADTMAPTLRRGAWLGVDTAAKKIVSGDMYALFIPYEGVGIRRIFLNAEENAFLLRADQPDFPETELSSEDLDRRLLGRVCWVMQML